MRTFVAIAVAATLAAAAGPQAIRSGRIAWTVCTWSFPPDGGVYATPVGPRDVICGGPGDDWVLRMDGGIFSGAGGNDRVGDFSTASAPGDMAGTFFGGEGDDLVIGQSGGMFEGGPGNDQSIQAPGPDNVFEGGDGDDSTSLFTGTFNGGAGNDTAGLQFSGWFNGGPGDDHIGRFFSGTFNGGPGRDGGVAGSYGIEVGTVNGGSGDDFLPWVAATATFNGGTGNDAVGCVGCFMDLGGGTFNGGYGNDHVDLLAGDGIFTGGLFAGGPGVDTVGEYRSGRCRSVVRCPR